MKKKNFYGTHCECAIKTFIQFQNNRTHKDKLERLHVTLYAYLTKIYSTAENFGVIRLIEIIHEEDGEQDL